MLLIFGLKLSIGGISSVPFNSSSSLFMHNTIGQLFLETYQPKSINCIVLH